MKTDFFFTTYLTENEHFIVADLIRQECSRLGIQVAYYRPFKTGHVPMYRECKLACSPEIGAKILKDLKVDFGNYHKSHKENMALLEQERQSNPSEAIKNFYERKRVY